MSITDREHPTLDTDSRLLPQHMQDAHRDVLITVQRGLAGQWEQARPRIAIIEHNGVATIYVSTAQTLDPALRAELREAAREALADYTVLGLYANVVFLRRELR